jgi:hypothetical protein
MEIKSFASTALRAIENPLLPLLLLGQYILFGKKDGVLYSCPCYMRKLPKPYLGTRHLEEAIDIMLFLNSFFLILFIFLHNHVIMIVKLCGVLVNLVYAWYFQRQFLHWTIIPK